MRTASGPLGFINLALTIRAQPCRHLSSSLGAQKATEMYDFEPDPSVTQALVGLRASDVERDLILATLQQTEGNRTHAAQILGISIRTMRNKLREYADQGMDVPLSATHEG